MVMTCGLVAYPDVHYTKPEVAKAICEHYAPTGRVLEPFKGGGVFLPYLPANSEWAEIDEGRDFFNICDDGYDWIVTNPPFSNLTDVFAHAFKLSENCVFLIPVSKYFSSNPRLELARKYGGLKEILHMGTGRDIGFDIGFPFGAMHFQKGFTGDTKQSWISGSKYSF